MHDQNTPTEINNIHHQQGLEVKVSEFELQLWRVFYGFLRWQEECEKSINDTFLSGNELAILHIIKLKNKSKTIIDIERLLNRDDTHNIRYSLKKLIQHGLVKKTLSYYGGKNHFFEITEKGIEDTENFLKMRKEILVEMFKQADFDLEKMTQYLTKLKTIYDEADRAVAQHFISRDTHIALENSLQKSRGKVLVVEDHPTAAKITYQMISNLNYHVDIASSGDMAFNLLKENTYDIILMDIGLPDMDGCEITRKIRATKELGHSFTPIIGLTVHVSNEDKRQCIESGMNAVFAKPLMKDKISDIFSMFNIKKPDNKRSTAFIKDSKEAKEGESLPMINGEIIDLTLGCQLVGGDETLAKEAIFMLVESISEELPNLLNHCNNQDINKAQLAIHKLRGGISYCGVPRLNEISLHFDEYLRSGKTELLFEYYNLLTFEVKQVKRVITQDTVVKDNIS